MNLNDLLVLNGINPEKVMVFRHRPVEPVLRKVLPRAVHALPPTGCPSVAFMAQHAQTQS